MKERFLRGKTVPPLSNNDIHVICGCVKDFLRSLREPLIPTSLWKDFTNAAQNHDDKEAVRQLYKAILALPQANRDTLAFLILHLQRLVLSIVFIVFLSKTENNSALKIVLHRVKP